MPRKSEARIRLDTYGNELLAIYRDIAGLDGKQLRALAAEITKLTLTNCGRTTYRIAPLIKQAIIEENRHRAQKATAP
jgi:hypothetical protein